VRRARPELGENCAVVGVGILGQLIIQYLANLGVRRIIAIDQSKKRLDIAKNFGATHTLNVAADKALEPIAEITGGVMIDTIFEMTGNPKVLGYMGNLLRKLGKVVLVGDTPTPSLQCLGPGFVSNAVQIIGSHGYVFHPWNKHELVSLFFHFIETGKMSVKDLITGRYSFQEAPEIYKRLVQDRSKEIGIVLDWTQS
jgi:threonine dehydrogenase-like Zn-dependent dehydrogenase